MSFLSSLASLTEFLNEEKSTLLKLVEWLKQTKTWIEATALAFSHIAMDASSTQSVNILDI